MKIVWVIQAPISIYINIFKHLKERNPDWDLIFALSNKFERVISTKIKKQYNLKAYRFPENSNYFKLLEIPYQISKIFPLGLNILKPDFMILRGLKTFLYEQKPDFVIISLHTQPYATQAYKFCMKTNTPYMIQSQTKDFSENFLIGFIQKLLLLRKRAIFKNAKVIQCWTLDDFRFAKKFFPIKDKSKIKLIPAGIDINFFQKEESNKFREENKKYMLLMVGRYVYEKNFKTLFKAISYIKDNHDFPFKLNIVGYGPLENKVKQDIIAYGIEEVAEILGFVNYEDMNKLYTAHDVLILPSYKEPIGMAVPEALACGTPVIVSKACGSKLYVREGKNGFLFDPYKYRELLECIIKLRDEEVRKQFGKYGENLIKEKYSLEKTAEKFYELLKED